MNDGMSTGDLRRQAEERLTADDPTTGEDKDALIHELRVHQVELEIQNEELRRAQEQLQISRDAYLHLYNRAPVGYLTLDKNGFIRRHNDTILDMIGDSGGNLLNRPFDSLLAGDDGVLFRSRFRAFFSRPEGKNLEVRIRSAASSRRSPREVRLTGRRTACTGGQPDMCLLLAVTDITEQKESQRRVSALLEEKDLLMREIHHRVKNNLNTVIAILGLQTERAPESAKAVITSAAERVRTMMAIYELLQESQDYREVDLERYLGILVDRITDGQASRDSLAINTIVDSLRVSPRRAVLLGIIVNEILSDACKHAFPTSRETDRVEIVLRAPERGGISLSIRDNGVGLTEEHLSAINAPFAASTAGGGLGLVLVRSLVDQLLGTLSVESANPGTRFVVTIPHEEPYDAGH